MKPLTYLNITQVLGAFNDNLFKFGLAFFLIELEGVESSNHILSLTSAVFVLPFIFFGTTAGQIADKISKSRLIVFTKILELMAMTLALFSVTLHLKWFSIFLLFMMAFQSTLFSPAKYGIIPELVPLEKIPKANGIITSSTFIAIIIGTAAASLILDMTHNNTLVLMVFAIIVALFGLAASLFIPYTTPVKKGTTVDTFFWKAAISSLKEMSKKPPFLLVAFSSAYFLFIASYIQLNMIPFAHEVLNLSILYGGYLIFLTAIGIAVGAYLVGTFGKAKLEIVPYACFLMGVILILLDRFSNHLGLELLLLPLAGFFGGFYQVPLDAFIQVNAPDVHRGAYIGTVNLLGFLGVLLSSLVLYLFKEAGLKPDQGFALMGALTCSLAILLFFRMRRSSPL